MGGLGGVDDGAGLCAAALVVLDDGALGGAGAGLLAGRAIAHVVVELEVAVELGGDVELGHGEGVDVLGVLAGERGRLGDVGVADTAGVLAGGLGGAGIDARGALAALGVAGEAGPGEAAVAGEATVGDLTEVEAAALGAGALVLAVLGVEREEVSSGRGASSQGEDRDRLHLERIKGDY